MNPLSGPPPRLFRALLALLPLLLLAPLEAFEGEIRPSPAVLPATATLPLDDPPILRLRLHDLPSFLASLGEVRDTLGLGRMLPPEARPLLEDPGGFLAALSAGMLGRTFSLDDPTRAFGLALDRPIAVDLSFPPNGWIARLPLHDPEAVLFVLLALLDPEEIELVPAGDSHSLRWKLDGEDLPSALYLAFDARTLAVSPYAFLVESALSPTPAPNEAETIAPPAPPEAAGPAQTPLALTLDPAAFRGDNWVAELRGLPSFGATVAREIAGDLPLAQQVLLDQSVRDSFGLADTGELIHYAEAIANGIFGVLLQTLSQQAEALQSLSLSTELDGTRLRLRLTLRSDSLAGADSFLPATALPDSLTALPGRKIWVTAAGAAEPATDPFLVGAFLAAILRELEEMELDPAFLGALATYWRELPPPLPRLPIEDWSVTATDWTFPAPRWREDADLQGILEEVGRLALTESWTRSVRLAPRAGRPSFLPFFEERARRKDEAWADWQALRRQYGGPEPWAEVEHSARGETHGDGLEELTLDTTFRTRRGLLGFDEHLLVNRRILFHQRTPRFDLLFGPDSSPGTVRQTAEQGDGPTAPALLRLWEEAPPATRQAALMHTLPLVPGLLQSLRALEEAVHTELDHFLRECRRLHQRYPEADLLALVQENHLPIPQWVEAVRLDGESGRAYLQLLGGLRYPRPPLGPLLAAWREELLATGATNRAGGSAIFVTSAPGVASVELVHELNGLGQVLQALDRTLQPPGTPAPGWAAALAGRLRAPGEARVSADPLLLVNPYWYPPGDEERPEARTPSFPPSPTAPAPTTAYPPTEHTLPGYRSLAYGCVTRDDDGLPPFSVALLDPAAGRVLRKTGVTYDSRAACDRALASFLAVGEQVFLCGARDNDGLWPAAAFRLTRTSSRPSLVPTGLVYDHPGECRQALGQVLFHEGSAYACASTDADGLDPYSLFALHPEGVTLASEPFPSFADCYRFLTE